MFNLFQSVFFHDAVINGLSKILHVVLFALFFVLTVRGIQFFIEVNDPLIYMFVGFLMQKPYDKIGEFADEFMTGDNNA